jgi:hypothetical protein
MHIRMTTLGRNIPALLAAGALATSGIAVGALAAGGIASADSPGGAAGPRTALIIDASLARDGRDLIDARLEGLDAELRVPRTAHEARTNVRYFTTLGYRLVVTGPDASAAADATGVRARHERDLAGAVAAVSH